MTRRAWPRNLEPEGPAPPPVAGVISEQLVVGEHAAVAVPVDPAVAVVESYPTEAEWLTARRRFITASEIAAVLGLSRHASAMSVWLDKLGLAEPGPELERLRWGRRLQGPIAAGFRDETGRAVLDPGPFTLLRSVRYPWLAASPDYFTARPDVSTPGVLEVKNASAYAKREWADEPPVPYQLQLQTQLLVTGFTWGTLVALIGGAELLVRDLGVHDTAVAVILDETERFWRGVQTGTPPPADGSDATTAAIRRLYPSTDLGPVVTLPADAGVWDAAIADGELEIERLTEIVNAAKNHLRLAIGNFESGRLPDGTVWAHKLERRKGYTKTVEPWEGRVLRRRGPRVTTEGG